MADKTDEIDIEAKDIADPERSGTTTVETHSTPPSKAVRPRNYSHLERNPETLDEVIGVDGVPYKIPATMGSNYWAVLTVMYKNVNTPVYLDALVAGVDAEMRDHDEDSWDGFCNKEKTTVWKRGSAQREIQAIKPWQDRIINNAKTLTRWKDYGKRLYERGHVLRYEYDDKVKPYFILRTSLDCLKKSKESKPAKTPKVKTEKVEAKE